MIYIKRFLLYTIIDYEYKTSELKNVEKLVEQTVKALKSCWSRLGMCIFVQSVPKITFPVGGPSKVPKRWLQLFV